MSENLNTSQKDPWPNGRVTDLPSLYRELQQRRIYYKLLREAAAWSLAVQSLLAPEPRPEEKGALGEAMSFLRAALENGARPARELQANARQAGIAVITLKRAKFLLRVESVKTDTTGPWYWQLPGQITENMDIPSAVALPTAGEADQETLQQDHSRARRGSWKMPKGIMNFSKKIMQAGEGDHESRGADGNIAIV